MIKSLSIFNYAIISHVEISFNQGFSTITGETGAGKSIILGALGLLCGQRADIHSIKQGEKKCVVEGDFDIKGYGLEQWFTDNDLDQNGDECVIRRELTIAGKSRAFVNDTPVSLALLKELSGKLIDIHSQHQNLTINDETFKLKVLDILSNHQGLISDYTKTYKSYKELSRRLEECIENQKRNASEEDYLRFQLQQLQDADVKSGEDAELEKESDILSHAEDIKHSLYSCQLRINPDDDMNMLQELKQCVSELNGLNDVYPESKELSERLDSCRIELADIADELESQAESIDYDPERLDWITNRLNLLNDLMHKHRVASTEDLLRIQSEISDKLSLIDNSDEAIETLRKQRDEAYKETLRLAEKISEDRKAVSPSFSDKMVEILSSIGIPNARFKVSFNRKSSPSPTGIDDAGFKFSANKKSEMHEVADIASGGEISRVMLSIKSIISDAVAMPTIIFDEVDTGVSGSVAEKMANIMRDMSQGTRQVISITHVPQIAAKGSYQYKVYKDDVNDSTSTHIIQLTEEQRIREIANMLSGETMTEAAISNAKELLGI